MTSKRLIREFNDDLDAILPHRKPMRFVDRVASFDPEARLLATELEITQRHCDGHYPGQPIFPGFLVAEALAQTSAILLHHLQPDYQGKIPVLTEVDSIRFKGIVVPGDCLVLEVKMKRSRRAMAKFSGRAYVRRQLPTGLVEIKIAIVNGLAVSFIPKAGQGRED